MAVMAVGVGVGLGLGGGGSILGPPGSRTRETQSEKRLGQH